MRPLRRFQWTLLIVWTLLCAGGFVYAHHQHIPARIAVPIVAAFLWEASFYLAPGFETVRRRLEARWKPPALAAGFASSAVIPYCVYSLPLGVFRLESLFALAGLAFTVAFWYVVFPRSGPADAGFLAFAATVVLVRTFPQLYASPVAGLELSILGQLMWIRLGALVVLLIRRAEGIGFGFLPQAREWRIGLWNALLFLPVGLPLALGLGWVRFEPLDLPPGRAAATAMGTFLGMLWVVALSEELFFRGLLQQWLSAWLASPRGGLIGASVLFGLAHLPFREFPNWRFATVAAVAGFFYGRAFQQASSIRASMVSHALVNTVARMFFV
ncbi:MAG: CPBP family glutamic-type intramembrane protease [Bryobacteraceae bacterium]|nr:CPBP family glutamic-type intramembrane protease [Bryobacteraceae bacterium]